MTVSPGGPGRRASLPRGGTPLVGREAELARLAGLLTDPGTRLTTLTGPPGVGKTRLAQAAAAAVGGSFEDGAAFVDLTAVRDPDLVLSEIAAALGPAPGAGGPTPDPLHTLLVDRHLLLVLDNFEQVLPAGPEVAELVAGCPRLTVLVTSRERLHLQAEQEIPVHPLALPGPGDVADVARLAVTPSVVMLVQRVRAYRPDFSVTAANRAALAEICVRLDGLPLALELAAPRLRLFTPGELTIRLRSRAAMLASDARDVPERHRTVHAAVSWSHDLLGPEERAMFRRLSVFTGGWTLAAAEHVCAVPDPVGTTASLVDKSLLRRENGPDDIARFGMLESLREFAADLLEDAGELEATRTRHAQHVARVAAAIDGRIGTVEERAAVEEAGLEAGNLRAAFAFCLAAGWTTSALTVAAALGWYAYTRGQLGAGQATLEAAIAAAGTAVAPDDALAGALLMAGAVAIARGDLDRAEERLLRSRTLTEHSGALRRTAVTTAFLGHLARLRGRPEEAVALYERAGLLHAELANAPGVAWSGYDLGLLARRRGDDDGAAELLREALGTFRDLNYAWAIACSAWALATVELRRGRVREAAGLLLDSMDCFGTVDDGRGVGQCVEAAATVACERSAHRTAARLLGAAAALRDRLSAPLPDEERAVHDAVAGRVRQALGPDDAAAAVRVGRSMSTTAVCATARDVLAGALPDAPPAGALTPREHEVAILVRHGCTNRQIGRRLGITEKTAEVHVHNIIRKLGARSRAEIAAWVAAGAAGGGP